MIYAKKITLVVFLICLSFVFSNVAKATIIGGANSVSGGCNHGGYGNQTDCTFSVPLIDASLFSWSDYCTQFDFDGVTCVNWVSAGYLVTDSQWTIYKVDLDVLVDSWPDVDDADLLSDGCVGDINGNFFYCQTYFDVINPGLSPQLSPNFANLINNDAGVDGYTVFHGETLGNPNAQFPIPANAGTTRGLFAIGHVKIDTLNTTVTLSVDGRKDGVAQISGCTDPSATNYNPSANTNDGSCIYPVAGCTDPTAINYNPKATTNDGSCKYPVPGCTDPKATNYDPKATSDNGSCKYSILGCTDPKAVNYDPGANTNDGSCSYKLKYSLTVFKSVGGTVKSTDKVINCGNSCLANYNDGDSVTLVATPSSTYWQFLQWGMGDCSGTNPSCTILINGNKSASAIFAPRAFDYKEF